MKDAGNAADENTIPILFRGNPKIRRRLLEANYKGVLAAGGWILTETDNKGEILRRHEMRLFCSAGLRAAQVLFLPGRRLIS